MQSLNREMGTSGTSGSNVPLPSSHTIGVPNPSMSTLYNSPTYALPTLTSPHALSATSGLHCPPNSVASMPPTLMPTSYQQRNAITNEILNNLFMSNPHALPPAASTSGSYGGSIASEQLVGQMQNIHPNEQLVHVELTNGQSMTVTMIQYEEMTAGFTKGPVPQYPTASEMAKFCSLDFLTQSAARPAPSTLSGHVTPSLSNAVTSVPNAHSLILSQPPPPPPSSSMLNSLNTVKLNSMYSTEPATLPTSLSSTVISSMPTTLPHNFQLSSAMHHHASSLPPDTANHLHHISGSYPKRPETLENAAALQKLSLLSPAVTPAPKVNSVNKSRSSTPQELDVEGTDDSDKSDYPTVNTIDNSNTVASNREDTSGCHSDHEEDGNVSCVSMDESISDSMHRSDVMRRRFHGSSVSMSEMSVHSEESNSQSLNCSSTPSPNPASYESESSNLISRK
jgi:hypothetical protein